MKVEMIMDAVPPYLPSCTEVSSEVRKYHDAGFSDSEWTGPFARRMIDLIDRISPVTHDPKKIRVMTKPDGPVVLFLVNEVEQHDFVCQIFVINDQDEIDRFMEFWLGLPT